MQVGMGLSLAADRASAARRLASRGTRWEVCEQAGRTSSAIATLNLSCDRRPKHADIRPAGPRLRKAHGVLDAAGRARVGLTPIPRLDRLYFWLGEPIDSGRFGSRFDDTTAARTLREEVKQASLTRIQFPASRA